MKINYRIVIGILLLINSVFSMFMLSKYKPPKVDRNIEVLERFVESHSHKGRLRSNHYLKIMYTDTKEVKVIGVTAENYYQFIHEKNLTLAETKSHTGEFVILAIIVVSFVVGVIVFISYTYEET